MYSVRQNTFGRPPQNYTPLNVYIGEIWKMAEYFLFHGTKPALCTLNFL